MLWATQVAPGKGNELKLSLFGSMAGVEWDQEQPNQIRFTRLGQPTAIVERGSDALNFGGYTTRLPAHHPEGYLEAFAQIYPDAATFIQARIDRRVMDRSIIPLPEIADGIEGLCFINAAIASHHACGWVTRSHWTCQP